MARLLFFFSHLDRKNRIWNTEQPHLVPAPTAFPWVLNTLIGDDNKINQGVNTISLVAVRYHECSRVDSVRNGELTMNFQEVLAEATKEVKVFITCINFS